MKLNAGVLLLACLFAVTVAQAQSKPSTVNTSPPLFHEQMEAANAHDTDGFLATIIAGISAAESAAIRRSPLYVCAGGAFSRNFCNKAWNRASI
jgi:hypothetical protein